MNSKSLLKLISVLCAIVLVVVSIVGCSKGKVEETTTKPTQKTTTTTTIIHTTEDTKTTFAENYTNKVYPALYKDKNSSFDYKLASYSTTYNTNEKERTKNLETAVSKINYIVVPSGEVFSLNQNVGKRTVIAGYKTAKVVAGDEFVDGLGGGVCQVSSTVFEAILRANMSIVERACHSLKISYVPLGGDATVQWNSQDFKFKNSQNCDIRLQFTCKDGKLTCDVYGNKKVDVGKVKISITGSNSDYTLTRTVNGKQNYIAYSHYNEMKS